MTNYERIQKLKRREYRLARPQCSMVITLTYEAKLADRAGVVLRCARAATDSGLCWQHAKRNP